MLVSAAGLPAAHGQIAVRSSLAEDQTIAPGRSYEGTIVIENLTDKSQQARVEAKDYRFTADGTNAFPAAGSLPRSNADWISFQPSVVTLPPQSTAEVSYRVSVPSTLSQADSTRTPRGTYWSVLMVEPIARGSAASTLEAEDEERAFGVRQVTRFGVQIATHVTPQPTPNINISNAQLVADSTAPALVVDLKNEGAAMARPTVQLELYDSDGSVALRRRSSPSRLYPSTSIRNRLPLDSLAAGRYEALVIVNASGDRVEGAQYTIEL